MWPRDPGASQRLLGVSKVRAIVPTTLRCSWPLHRVDTRTVRTFAPLPQSNGWPLCSPHLEIHFSNEGPCVVLSQPNPQGLGVWDPWAQRPYLYPFLVTAASPQEAGQAGPWVLSHTPQDARSLRWACLEQGHPSLPPSVPRGLRGPTALHARERPEEPGLCDPRRTALPAAGFSTTQRQQPREVTSLPHSSAPFSCARLPWDCCGSRTRRAGRASTVPALASVSSGRPRCVSTPTRPGPGSPLLLPTQCVRVTNPCVCMCIMCVHMCCACTCMHMCVCMHVLLHVCVRAYVCRTCVCACVCLCTCVLAMCVHVCTCGCTCVCARAYTHARVCTYVWACMCVRMVVHACMCVHCVHVCRRVQREQVQMNK